MTKLAEDRAEQLRRDPDRVPQELERRLRLDLRQTGEFARVHPLPQSGQDVPDDRDARLVVLGAAYPYSQEPGCPAETAAAAILARRGNAPRLYANTLVFLAPDRTRLQELDEAIRRFLAWESILAERVELNLDPLQVKQAETQRGAADGTVTARLPETYRWLLVPGQASPQAAVEWQAVHLSGQNALAVRASNRLVHDELLLTRFAGTRLRMDLDKVPLWRGDQRDHVAVRQLLEDFARYLYLPRLKGPEVLAEAVVDGVALLTWEQETFAYADDLDAGSGRFRGLHCGQLMGLTGDAPGMLVRPDVARLQLNEAVVLPPPITPPNGAGPGQEIGLPLHSAPPPPPATQPRRYHGTVALDPERVGRDAGRIAEEVIAHLSGLVGARVTVMLEVQAEMPAGAPEHVVRTVTENGRVLKFTSQGFERE